MEIKVDGATLGVSKRDITKTKLVLHHLSKGLSRVETRTLESPMCPPVVVR